MNYQTYPPHPDLEALVKCYWTLEVPAAVDAPRQRIIPDGCIEMAFLLADDIKRYTSETNFVLQPRAMVIGQITEAMYIQPVGRVNTFAIRFYPYGFSNFVTTPLKDLSDKETPLALLFGNEASNKLEQKIIQAKDTQERIEVCENFLLDTLRSESTSNKIVKSTIEALMSASGNHSIKSLFNHNDSKRRQLERQFARQVGLSPKQLGKVLRLQAALKMMLHQTSENYTQIAYDSAYYDQAHFIRDFKEFTGTTPSDFLGDENLALSSIIYKKG